MQRTYGGYISSSIFHSTIELEYPRIVSFRGRKSRAGRTRADYGIVFQGGTIRGENLNLRNLRGRFSSSVKEGEGRNENRCSVLV